MYNVDNRFFKSLFQHKNIPSVMLFFLLILYCSNFFAMLCATYYFPAPLGTYGVGRRTYHWTRTVGDSYVSHNKLENVLRSLNVHIWYPTQERGTIPSSDYLPEVVNYLKMSIPIVHKVIPEPLWSSWMFDLKVYAVDRAPLLSSSEKFPIIIFSHGLEGLSGFNTVHIENLASNGYVVVGIDHTGSCLFSTFPDGETIDFDFDWELPGKIDRLNALTKTWVDDVSFVIDKMTVLQTGVEDSFFKDVLDLDKIGMFGHSFGGATTAHICNTDKRVKAGINLDGPLLGPDIHEGFSKPFMVIIAEETFQRMHSMQESKKRLERSLTMEERNTLSKAFIQKNAQLCNVLRQRGAPAYYLFVKGANHHTFTDFPLIKMSSQLFKYLFDYFEIEVGSIAADYIARVINEYMVAFFDKYVAEKELSSLLTGQCYLDVVVHF